MMKETLIITISEKDFRNLIVEIIDQKAESLKVVPKQMKTYTLEGAAKILKVSKATLRNYVLEGHIQCSFIGNSSKQNYRFTEEQLQNSLRLIPTIKYKRHKF